MKDFCFVCVKESDFPVDLENCITLDEVGCEDEGGQTENCKITFGSKVPSGSEVPVCCR